MRSAVSSLFLLGGIALAGCASNPYDTADKPAKAGEQYSSEYHCLRDTGTRIKLRQGRCAIAAGQTYSSRDLRREGTPTLDDALRRLGGY